MQEIIVIYGKPMSGKTELCKQIQQKFKCDTYVSGIPSDILILDGQPVPDNLGELGYKFVIIVSNDSSFVFFNDHYYFDLDSCADENSVLEFLSDKMNKLCKTSVNEVSPQKISVGGNILDLEKFKSSIYKKDVERIRKEFNLPVIPNLKHIYAELPKFELNLEESEDEPCYTEAQYNYVKSAMRDAQDQFNDYYQRYNEAAIKAYETQNLLDINQELLYQKDKYIQELLSTISTQKDLLNHYRSLPNMPSSD